MTNFSTIPPPPASQPLVTVTIQGLKEHAKTMVYDNQAWIDWFNRLRQQLIQIILVPPTFGSPGSLLGVNSTGTDFQYFTIGGTSHEITATQNFSTGTITLSTPQPIDTSSSVTFANVTDSALSQHALVLGGAGGILASLGVASNGQLAIGSTGANPVLATLTPGAGINIANGAGSITISSTVTGTVTSVGLADGSTTPIYNISGSPVTSSGTLTFTLANETANQVFAGPTSGAAAQPTFRALVTADVSSIAVTNLLGTANEVAVSAAIGTSTVSLSGPHNFTTQTAHGLLLGQGTSAITALADATNGQIPIGSTGADPVLATLTPGSGISITNGAGSITIAATGGGGTVTSVALSDGSTTPIYTISGSPITGSGTLTFTLATESANKVFAGPSSGSAAQPTFRSLVTADLPAGTGTVTSVALSDGSTTPIYTISGSPITGSGTLTFTLATQSANKIFTGPTSGAATQPTFRSMILADIPGDMFAFAAAMG